MNQGNLQVEVIQENWQQTLQGEPVLFCQLTYPQVKGKGYGPRAVNRYYRRVAETWKRRWKRELYLRACLDLADCTAAGGVFQPWQAQVETQVALACDGLLSLWQEGRETQGKQPAFVLRRGDSWNLRTGAPIMLADIVGRKRHWRRELLQQVQEQMQQRLNQGECLLFRDYATLVNTRFDPTQFWLEADGMRIFYQPEVLASRVEGTIVVPISMPGRE